MNNKFLYFLKGKFITFEGIEGVGKSSNLLYLKNQMSIKNISCILTKSIYDSLIGNIIRNIFLSKKSCKILFLVELLLIIAERIQHINDIILPSLYNNKCVLCDRFIDSTYVYQFYKKNEKNYFLNFFRKYGNNLLIPDLTFFLDLPVKISIERVKSRKNVDRIESRSIYFFKIIRLRYFKIMKKNLFRFKIISTLKSKKIVNKYVLRQMRLFVIKNKF